MKDKEEIAISMEEYKELLIIKGKYEELKSNQSPIVWREPTLTRTIYDGQDIPTQYTKVTC